MTHDVKTMLCLINRGVHAAMQKKVLRNDIEVHPIMLEEVVRNNIEKTNTLRYNNHAESFMCTVGNFLAGSVRFKIKCN